MQTMILNNSTQSVRSGIRSLLVSVGYHSKPSFLILGAQKAGTSAVHKYLSYHPNIVPSTKKEVHFFDADEAYLKYGFIWYHRFFPLPFKLGERAVTFETTPEYLYYPKVAQRIYAYNPQIKLVILLRDPIERAYSAWNMFRNRFYKDREQLLSDLAIYKDEVRSGLVTLLSGNCFKSFEEVVQDEINRMQSGTATIEPSFVRRGFYDEQIARFMNYFGENQIHIVDSGLLRSETVQVLGELVSFLGLPGYDWSQESFPPVHARKYIEPIPARTRAFLEELYQSHNLRLYELLGRDFGW